MFSKPAVRSRAKIIKGLLTRAFERGGEKEREQMQLLIEWRLAACRHSNNKALKQFASDYKLDDMRNYVPSGSRGIDAYNWISVIEDRDDFLTDASMDKKIADIERMHHVARFFKNSEIIVDLEKLKIDSYNKNPNAPIIFDLPQTKPSQRSSLDMVYMKSTETPSYLKTLSEIDSKIDSDEGSGGGSKGVRKEHRQTHGFQTALKPTFH